MLNGSHGVSPEPVDPPSPECPYCRMTNGHPIEVEEGHGYRRVTYRCGNCQHTWAQTTDLAPETLSS